VTGDFSAAFSAAKRSGYRGFFYFPTLDSAKQMPRATRDIINKKANWLYNNVAPVRAVVDGLSLDEADTGLWPKWTTSNPAFNKAATDAFDNECGDPRFFHAAGRESFYSAQLLIRRSIRLYGELFAQFLRPLASMLPPLCHFVNTWQCANGKTPLPQDKWDDGVMSDKFGRAIQYRFLKNDEGTAWDDVNAEDVLHLHDQFWNGQQRGMSGLACVASKLFSMDDIERAEISGTLMRTRLAYAITKKEDSDGMAPLLPGAAAVEIDSPQGGKMIVQKITAMDDSEVDVADLPAGQDMKVIESNRASSTTEFLKHMLRGFAQTTLYPEEYVFGLAGLGQGTLVRLVQKRVQRIKNSVRQFQLRDQFCRRWVIYWTWQRIASGRFDGVEGGIPSDWWKHKIIMPADDTVDVAREGKLYDQRLADGNMSRSDYHGMQGRDAEDVEDEVIAEKVRFARKLKKAMDANPDVSDLIKAQFSGKTAAITEPAAPQDPVQP
jgi:capsid protein